MSVNLNDPSGRNTIMGNQRSSMRKLLVRGFNTSQDKIGAFKVFNNTNNPRQVRDSSDFTRFKKSVAINNNYNDNGVPILRPIATIAQQSILLAPVTPLVPILITPTPAPPIISIPIPVPEVPIFIVVP